MKLMNEISIALLCSSFVYCASFSFSRKDPNPFDNYVNIPKQSRSDIQVFGDFKRRALFLSSENEEYRSISDVVGNLHGGKYQFNNFSGASSSDAFSGRGSRYQNIADEDEADVDLPNWAMKMKPSEAAFANPQLLSIPSNCNPMDGMVYSASVDIQNQEISWEKFHCKLMVMLANGEFIEADASIKSHIQVKPKHGSLAPRGGASNACDRTKPYSDRATIRITHGSSSSLRTTNDEIWLVLGTEEEKWYYKLILE
ncbi:hypothetical protein CTEN210_17209 [Chaetoceros tenuissimus]|uniref:Uncharacterized protein n=1 Tax=Chaetoceros tenuissimus TaxID=426638 RepID=A0AAD3DAE0_9STRA|nr:hypothetical protein CTEN210_17209 [Chaetoceros tenuissimus]